VWVGGVERGKGMWKERERVRGGCTRGAQIYRWCAAQPLTLSQPILGAQQALGTTDIHTHLEEFEALGNDELEGAQELRVQAQADGLAGQLQERAGGRGENGGAEVSRNRAAAIRMCAKLRRCNTVRNHRRHVRSAFPQHHIHPAQPADVRRLLCPLHRPIHPTHAAEQVLELPQCVLAQRRDIDGRREQARWRAKCCLRRWRRRSRAGGARRWRAWRWRAHRRRGHGGLSLRAAVRRPRWRAATGAYTAKGGTALNGDQPVYELRKPRARRRCAIHLAAAKESTVRLHVRAPRACICFGRNPSRSCRASRRHTPR
jgi:hypothetical protein